jgi:CRISPR system Cascade subunit CasE
VSYRVKSADDVITVSLLRLGPSGLQLMTHAAYLKWMQRQGAAHGFLVEQETFQVLAHYRESIPRRNAAPALINCGELLGLLTVTDAQALGTCLAEGLGASRSFGCGLLEVARVN